MEYRLPQGYTDRAAYLDDTPQLVELFNAADSQLLGEGWNTVEDQMVEFSEPGRSLEQDFRVVVSPQGQLVGYYEVFGLFTPYTPLYCWGRVHPHHQGRGIGAYLLSWAEQQARRALPLSPSEAQVTFVAYCHEVDAAAQALFASQGMQPVRHVLRMLIELKAPPLEPTLPEGILIRPVRPGVDEYPAFVARSEAFSDHWGHVEHPIEEEYRRWQERVTGRSDYDPSLWFVAWAGGEVAGSALNNNQFEEDPKFGWVANLSVRRPYRKQGLGLALLQHSFGEFYRRGYQKVALSVDAENKSGAVRLYEKAGMHVDPRHAMVRYHKELRPGKALMVG